MKADTNIIFLVMITVAFPAAAEQFCGNVPAGWNPETYAKSSSLCADVLLKSDEDGIRKLRVFASGKLAFESDDTALWGSYHIAAKSAILEVNPCGHMPLIFNGFLTIQCCDLRVTNKYLYKHTCAPGMDADPLSCPPTGAFPIALSLFHSNRINRPIGLPAKNLTHCARKLISYCFFRHIIGIRGATICRSDITQQCR